MVIIENVFLLLGAIAVFSYGLKKISEQTGMLCGGRLNSIVHGATGNVFCATAAGILSTAVMQSSIATNMISITFVEKGIISFYTCAAIIMGTNVGTTMTAQLVSLSSAFDFNMSAIGCFVAFLGFLFTLSNKKTLKCAGGAMLGFGFIFIGMKIMTEAVQSFKYYEWFNNLFLVKNPVLLFLNGLVLTALLQSSSVITSVMIVLASIGLISFHESLFIVLGSNIGTCIPVMLASANMSIPAKKAAFFNLVFNVFGAAVFFLPLALLKGGIESLYIFSFSASRNIANFHTFFNLILCVGILPFLKQFTALTEKLFDIIYGDNSVKKRKCGKIKAKNTIKKSKTIDFKAF